MSDMEFAHHVLNAYKWIKAPLSWVTKLNMLEHCLVSEMAYTPTQLMMDMEHFYSDLKPCDKSPDEVTIAMLAQLNQLVQNKAGSKKPKGSNSNSKGNKKNKSDKKKGNGKKIPLIKMPKQVHKNASLTLTQGHY